MTLKNLNRRSFIRGAGSIAIGLPWLEAMNTQASTSSATAKRFVAVYTPGGAVMNKWYCSGTENNYTLSPILEPLANMQHKLNVMHGLDLKSAVGEQHQSGIVALLSGTPQSNAHRGYASGPSIDQVIASHIGGETAKKSIEVAIRWATGKSYGLLHPINSLNFEDNAQFNPIPPRLDPVEIWQDMFGALDPNNQAAAAALVRKKSILDFVDRRYVQLSNQLGVEDRSRLEQHLTKIREVENALDAQVNEGGQCKAPDLVDTSGYNPKTGLNSSHDGSRQDVSTDASIPVVGKLMTDIIVMALACEVTNVATLQWSDTEAKHTFPWLGLSQHHHFYQHDGGFRPNECEKIGNWYAQQHAYLLEQMDSIDVGGRSLLDDSIVFFGSEISDPPSHSKRDMPLLLAGQGGGMRSGRVLRFNGRSHNDLLSAICHLFGIEENRFGSDQYASTPLENLA